MRMIALTVVVLGVAVLGGTRTSGQTAPNLYKANTIEMATDLTSIQLRGDVQIQSGQLVILADEADVAAGAWGASREVTLRGNVRVQLAPASADPLMLQLVGDITRQNNRRR